MSSRVSEGDAVSSWIFWKIIAPIVFFFLFQSRGVFVDDARPLAALKAHGFTNVTIIREDDFFVGFRGCSHGDAAKYTVRATNAAGETTDDIFVCSGWLFRGSTVRTW